ncbi:hypothetical protein CBR_g39146 [Chara braunii]|uniref:Uncharacterized protein n=1 Tax=Chara braunii TaxID=69332 RepID=A0A388LR79_CHABU|nr:hypothetical protein CBR_g39146 [Chara braunii]|eukprot:GBG84769.1 hypothetical protein CBR_g39146 [Chara braunii]
MGTIMGHSNLKMQDDSRSRAGYGRKLNWHLNRSWTGRSGDCASLVLINFCCYVRCFMVTMPILLLLLRFVHVSPSGTAEARVLPLSLSRPYNLSAVTVTTSPSPVDEDGPGKVLRYRKCSWWRWKRWGNQCSEFSHRRSRCYPSQNSSGIELATSWSQVDARHLQNQPDPDPNRIMLASDRTHRPNPLNNFKDYNGGWDITNVDYLASVGFTGAPGIGLAVGWVLYGAVQMIRWYIQYRSSSRESATKVKEEETKKEGDGAPQLQQLQQPEDHTVKAEIGGVTRDSETSEKEAGELQIGEALTAGQGGGLQSPKATKGVEEIEEYGKLVVRDPEQVQPQLQEQTGAEAEEIGAPQRQTELSGQQTARGVSRESEEPQGAQTTKEVHGLRHLGDEAAKSVHQLHQLGEQTARGVAELQQFAERVAKSLQGLLHLGQQTAQIAQPTKQQSTEHTADFLELQQLGNQAAESVLQLQQLREKTVQGVQGLQKFAEKAVKGLQGMLFLREPTTHGHGHRQGIEQLGRDQATSSGVQHLKQQQQQLEEEECVTAKGGHEAQRLAPQTVSLEIPKELLKLGEKAAQGLAQLTQQEDERVRGNVIQLPDQAAKSAKSIERVQQLGQQTANEFQELREQAAKAEGLLKMSQHAVQGLQRFEQLGEKTGKGVANQRLQQLAADSESVKQGIVELGEEATQGLQRFEQSGGVQGIQQQLEEQTANGFQEIREQAANAEGLLKMQQHAVQGLQLFEQLDEKTGKGVANQRLQQLAADSKSVQQGLVQLGEDATQGLQRFEQSGGVQGIQQSGIEAAKSVQQLRQLGGTMTTKGFGELKEFSPKVGSTDGPHGHLQLVVASKLAAQDYPHLLEQVRDQTLKRTEELPFPTLEGQIAKSIQQLQQLGAQRTKGYQELLDLDFGQVAVRIKEPDQLPQLGTLAEKRLQRLEQLGEHAVQEVQDLKSVSRQTGMPVQQLQQLVEKTANGLQGAWGFGEQLSNIGDPQQLLQLGTRAEERLQRLEQLVEQKLQGVQELQSVGEQAGKSVQQLQQLGEKATNGIQDLHQFPQHIVKQGLKGLQQVGEQTVRGIQRLQSIRERAGESVKHLQQLGEEAAKGFHDLREFGKQVTDIKERQQFLPLGVLAEQGLEGLEQLGEQTVKGVQELKSLAHQAGESVQQLQQLGEKTTSRFQGLQEFGEQVVSVKECKGKILELGAQAEHGLEGLEQFGEQTVKGVQELQSIGGEVGKSVQELQQLREEARKGLQDLRALGQQVANVKNIKDPKQLVQLGAQAKEGLERAEHLREQTVKGVKEVKSLGDQAGKAVGRLRELGEKIRKGLRQLRVPMLCEAEPWQEHSKEQHQLVEEPSRKKGPSMLQNLQLQASKGAQLLNSLRLRVARPMSKGVERLRKMGQSVWNRLPLGKIGRFVWSQATHLRQFAGKAGARFQQVQKLKEKAESRFQVLAKLREGVTNAPQRLQELRQQAAKGYRELRSLYRPGLFELILAVMVACFVAAIVSSVLMFYGQSEFNDAMLGGVDVGVNKTYEALDYVDSAGRLLEKAENYPFVPSLLGANLVSAQMSLQNKSEKVRQTVGNAKSEAGKIQQLITRIFVAAASLLLVPLALMGVSLGGRLEKLLPVATSAGSAGVFIGFIFFAMSLIAHNTTGDTCKAMEEFAANPSAESSLKDLIPCIDTKSADATLTDTRRVLHTAVDEVNANLWRLQARIPSSGVPIKLCNPVGPPPDFLQQPNGTCGPDALDFFHVHVSSPTCVSFLAYNKTLCDPALANISSLVTNLTGLYPSLENASKCGFVATAAREISEQQCPQMVKASKNEWVSFLVFSLSQMILVVLSNRLMNQLKAKRMEQAEQDKAVDVGPLESIEVRGGSAEGHIGPTGQAAPAVATDAQVPDRS